MKFNIVDDRGLNDLERMSEERKTLIFNCAEEFIEKHCKS